MLQIRIHKLGSLYGLIIKRTFHRIWRVVMLGNVKRTRTLNMLDSEEYSL